jgi:hypothetical protein
MPERKLDVAVCKLHIVDTKRVSIRHKAFTQEAETFTQREKAFTQHYVVSSVDKVSFTTEPQRTQSKHRE